MKEIEKSQQRHVSYKRETNENCRPEKYNNQNKDSLGVHNSRMEMMKDSLTSLLLY